MQLYSYPTKCAQKPYIHVGNFWPGEFRAFFSLIKPSYKQVLKTVVGLTEPCGVTLVMRDVDELQVFGNPDLATAIIELPELAGGALLWWWLADVGFHAIKAFTSVLHVYHYCQPTAFFGTAGVGNTSLIMSGINDEFTPLTLFLIIEDPGNWVQLGGSNIHPPIRGTYRVFWDFELFAAFGSVEMRVGVHITDGLETRWEEVGHVFIDGGFTKTIVGSANFPTINENPVFNLGTWNVGPAFGCWVMPGSKMIVSSD